MKKIMIAIDYNPCAQKVAESGYAYAKEIGAQVMLVHAIADLHYYSMEYSPIMGFEGFRLDGPFNSIKDQVNEAFEYLSCAVRHLGDKKIKIKVLEGRTAETILEFANKWKADLLVVGSQSHDSFENYSIGNVTSCILRKSNIPVLVVPTEKHHLDFTNEKEFAFYQ